MYESPHPSSSSRASGNKEGQEVLGGEIYACLCPSPGPDYFLTPAPQLWLAWQLPASTPRPAGLIWVLAVTRNPGFTCLCFTLLVPHGKSSLACSPSTGALRLTLIPRPPCTPLPLLSLDLPFLPPPNASILFSSECWESVPRGRWAVMTELRGKAGLGAVGVKTQGQAGLAGRSRAPWLGDSLVGGMIFPWVPFPWQTGCACIYFSSTQGLHAEPHLRFFNFLW